MRFRPRAVPRTPRWGCAMTSRPTKAAAIVQQPIARFLAPDAAVIARAYSQSRTLLEARRLHEPEELASLWVQEEAWRYLSKDDFAAPLLSPDSDYRRFCGTIQTAYQEPSFCLGFTLAFLLFSDKGGVR